MFNKKRSFFERLTGMVDDSPEEVPVEGGVHSFPPPYHAEPRSAEPPLRDAVLRVAPQAFPQERDRDAYAVNSIPRHIAHAPLAGAPEEEADGQLAVDVYQTRTEIIVQTMVAGVRPDDLNINITHEQISISGRREGPHGIPPEDYYHGELYWGNFSRTVYLPQEVEPEEAEAIEKHGLLIIRLPKVDKAREHKLKIKQL